MMARPTLTRPRLARGLRDPHISVMSERKKPRVFMADDPALLVTAPPPAELDTLLPDAETLRSPAPRRFGFWTVFWGAVLGLIGLALGAAAYEFVAGLITAYPWVGWVAFGLMAIVFVGLLVFALREFAGLSRLNRIDGLRNDADLAWETHDRTRAESIRERLTALYRNRPELDRARSLIDERAP